MTLCAQDRENLERIFPQFYETTVRGNGSGIDFSELPHEREDEYCGPFVAVAIFVPAQSRKTSGFPDSPAQFAISLPPSIKVRDSEKEKLLQHFPSCKFRVDSQSGACTSIYGVIEGVPRTSSIVEHLENMARTMSKTLTVPIETMHTCRRRPTLEQIYYAFVGEMPIQRK